MDQQLNKQNDETGDDVGDSVSRLGTAWILRKRLDEAIAAYNDCYHWRDIEDGDSRDERWSDLPN